MRQIIIHQASPTIVIFEQPVERTVTVTAKPATAPDTMNHVWIWDRSGSMHAVLPELVEDLIAKAKTALKIGDSLTLGWFSGEGSRNFIVKGFKIATDADYAKLEAIIRRNAGSLGTTCFSEILDDLNQVVEDLWPINPDFALCFFTDGYPVVSNYAKELTAIYAAIAKAQAKLASVLLVGYGSYYNKELMAEMAAKFGGALTHSSNLAQFSASMTEFVLEARDVAAKVSVTVLHPGVTKASVYFSLVGKSVVAYEPKDGAVAFAPTKKGRSALYTVCGVALPNVRSEQFDADEVSHLRAAYAAALVLTQRTKTNQAIEILGATGDVALIDSVNNAFTNDDYGRAEALIKDAIASPKGRFLKGFDFKHLPDRNAFCLVELIDSLAEDDEARFYPYHPDFKYSRIGLKTEYADNTPKFLADANPSCELDAMTWNDNKLNLSVTTRISGKVALDGDAGTHGFATPYPTFIWRSLAFVKDGNCNVPEAPFSMSAETFHRLVERGLIKCCNRDTDADGNCDRHKTPEWEAGKAFLVQFHKVPVMNRVIAEGRTSAAALAKEAFKELQLEAKVKALKTEKAALEVTGAKDLAQATALTAAQEAYLAKFFISRNGFGAPGKAAEPTDHYQVKEFNIKIKGLSGLPSVKAVKAKLDSGKPLTLSESLVNDGLKLLAGAPKENRSRQLTWVNGQLAQVKSELRQTRKGIQRTKFAILLGKYWFDEMNSREDATVKVDNLECTVAIREVQVPI